MFGMTQERFNSLPWFAQQIHWNRMEENLACEHDAMGVAYIDFRNAVTHCFRCVNKDNSPAKGTPNYHADLCKKGSERICSRCKRVICQWGNG